MIPSSFIRKTKGKKADREVERRGNEEKKKRTLQKGKTHPKRKEAGTEKRKLKRKGRKKRKKRHHKKWYKISQVTCLTRLIINRFS